MESFLIGGALVLLAFLWIYFRKSTTTSSKKEKGYRPTLKQMSVVGIDFGNLNTVVAVARNRGIDVIVNEVSNRATP